jgi:hypothetical protein
MINPAVVVHAFLRIDPQTGQLTDAARSALSGMWQALSKSGGPIRSEWPTSADPLADLHRRSGPFAVLASVQPDFMTSGFHQTIVYRVHDVVGISVVDARVGPATTFDGFTVDWFTTWTALTADDLIGTAVVYSALTDQGTLQGDDPELLGRDLVRPPSWVAGDEWLSAWWRPRPELLAWEEPPSTGTDRRMLVVAGKDDEHALDAFVWNDEPGLRPLTRYLLHSSKLRHQYDILVGDRSTMRATAATVDKLTARLVGELNVTTPPLSRILRGDRAISDLQLGERGVIGYLTGVRDMAITADIARKNVDAVVGGTTSGGPGNPVEADRETADWMADQLRAEDVYLSSAQLRATEIGRLTSTTVETALARRRENLLLLQTAVIGAILMALTGIQAVEYQLTWLPGPLVAPAIFGFAALALWLPSAVLRWPRGGDGPFASFDVISAVVFGAAAGWVVASLDAEPWRTHQGASPGTSVHYAIIGAAVALAGSSLVLLIRALRRRRAGRSSSR